MNDVLRRLRGGAIALVVLALSASLTFGAQAPASGYALGGSFKDKPATAGTAGDEETGEDESTEEDESAGDGGDNCLTDPTGLSEEELAAMKHGSIVCWAAHQETPDGYANHGAWVSHWAHMGKSKGSDAAAAGKANGQGKGKGQKPAD